MRIKRKNGLKMIVIALVLLLCLALAVGITGAYYQAKRQATGTLNMDQGIIIDYKGFNKGDENIWQREKESTFLLFSETNAQPGEHIAVNAAGIRANIKSVDFYARVKLSYKFYNGEALLYDSNATTGNVENFKPSDLITTSANFFGTNWVDSGSSDGYYYYATGTTLNKFNKGTQTFVDLFATDAEFVIEGENFTGATSDGEGGGFVVGDTSINKIEVYLTLETLQGDVQTEELNTMGWKIASEVDFSKVDEGKIVKSNTTTEVTDEKLNVTINDKTTSLETVKFPYDEEVILNFDSRNVDYITLNYSNGETETFGLSADDFANDYLSETALKVTAKSSKGTVKGYTVGLWDSEYKGFKFTTTGYNDDGTTYEIANGIAISGYYGSDTKIEILSSYKVRERDFKVVIKNTNMDDWAKRILPLQLLSASYPCNLIWYDGTNSVVIGNFANVNEGMAFVESEWMHTHEFDDFTNYEFSFEYKTLCETTNIFNSPKEVKEIALSGLAYIDAQEIVIASSIIKIQPNAFAYSKITKIEIPSTIQTICSGAFYGCTIVDAKISNGIINFGDHIWGSGNDSGTITNLIIDSSYYAANLKEDLRNVSNIYVKTGLTVGTYITNSFTKAETSDKAGYDLYTKNA